MTGERVPKQLEQDDEIERGRNQRDERRRLSWGFWSNVFFQFYDASSITSMFDFHRQFKSWN